MTAAIALKSTIAAVFALLLFLGIVTIPLVPLPLFYVGLSTSPAGLIFSSLVFALLSAALIGWPMAITSILLFTLPAFALTRLSLMSRIRAHDLAPGSEAQPSDPRYEFYPAQKLILWATGMGIIITSLMFARFANEDGGLPAVFVAMLTEQPATAALLGLDDMSIDAAALRMVVITMIVSAGASWAISMIFSLLGAQRLSEWTTVNLRPKQNFDDLSLPPYLDIFLVSTIVLSIFLDGAWSVYFVALALCFLIPYFLLGLSVIHAISRPLDARIWILSALYLFLLLFFWLGILVALLGIIEPMLRLRQRYGPEKVAQKQQTNRTDDKDPPEKE